MRSAEKKYSLSCTNLIRPCTDMLEANPLLIPVSCPEIDSGYDMKALWTTAVVNCS